MYYKISVLVDLRKRRALEFGVDTVDAYTSKHQKKYNEAVKTIRLAYANVIAGLLEDLPFSLLGTYYIFTASELGTQLSMMAMLSTVSSSVMLGVKLCKLPALKSLWEEESKHKLKLERGVLGPSMQDLKQWLSCIDP